MDAYGFPKILACTKDWATDLSILRQNALLQESSFHTFLGEHGVRVNDLARLHLSRQVANDGTAEGPLFHKFRLYTVNEALKFADRDSGGWQQFWNGVVDLAILLEPLYWPQIVNRQSISTEVNENEYYDLAASYTQRVLDLVRTLDAGCWRKAHEIVRQDAARLDPNADLYLLLRLSSWERRESLRGPLGGALWIRHFAELIRRAFEEAQQETWPEEDRAFGRWPVAARERAYGAERPLDDELRAKPRLAYRYGLFTGSAVRWYVEGPTEYYALIEMFGDPAKCGIELVNLRGNIASEQANIALKLQDWLQDDKALRRFSMISFDDDVPINVKIIGRQIALDNIVGSIAKHHPDFEFANFTADELVTIAADLDEKDGVDGSPVRSGDWAGITTGRTFEQYYLRTSFGARSSLKGEAWGRALGRYALDHPHRADTRDERRLVRDFRSALYARESNYDYHRKRFGFDPVTFNLVPRP